MSTTRIDKWLWMVRVFKTRTLATEACKLGRVFMSGVEAKASREVKSGDIVDFKWQGIQKTYRIIEIPANRVGAKLLPIYIEDLTSEDEYHKLTMVREMNALGRERGTGRPTKKERRELDGFVDSL